LQFGHLQHRGRNLNNGFFPVQLFAALDFKPHRRRQGLPTLVLGVSRSPAEAVTGIHDDGNSQRDHIESGPATCGRIGALVVSTSDRLLVKCNLCASSWAREAFSSWFAGIGECVVRRLDGELDRDVRGRLSVFAAAQLQPVKQWGHAKSERPNHLLLCFQCSVSTTGRKSRYISPQIGSRGLAGDSPERYWRIAFRRCR